MKSTMLHFKKTLSVISLISILSIIIPSIGLTADEYSIFTSDLFVVVNGGETSYGATMPGVQPGDVIAWGDASEHIRSFMSNSWWSSFPMWLMGERDAKLVMAYFGYESIEVFNMVILNYISHYYPEKQYGVDYVITEYLPGAEAGMARFAAQLGDIRDINGRTINSYPAFADLNTLADIQYSYGTVIRDTDHDMFVRQFGAAYPYETTGQVFISTGDYALNAGFYGGVVKAVVDSPDEINRLLVDLYGNPFIFPIAEAGPPLVGIEEYNATFTFDASASYDPSGTIVDYYWDFGDGTNSTEISPTHSFEEGSYWVVLTVTSNRGIPDWDYTTIQIQDALPIADFSATPITGYYPLTVEFTDLSTSGDAIVSWNWEFGDGQRSILQNPTHTYPSVGSYSVTLTVYEVDGSNTTKNRPNYIQVEQDLSFIGAPGLMDDIIIIVGLVAIIPIAIWLILRNRS